MRGLVSGTLLLRLLALLSVVHSGHDAAIIDVPTTNSELLSGKEARKLQTTEDPHTTTTFENDDPNTSFLRDYRLKLVYCKAGVRARDPETGEFDNNVVIFRLCPQDSCNSETETGCSNGYGEFVVGLKRFVQAYMDDQRSFGLVDDDLQDYSKCTEYIPPDNKNNAVEIDSEIIRGGPYYIGPACTENGSQVRLQLFLDSVCSKEATNVTFEDISGGWSLPYRDGGFVPDACLPCGSRYDSGGNPIIGQVTCRNSYWNSGKCETHMETYQPIGKHRGSCEYIHSLIHHNCEDLVTNHAPPLASCKIYQFCGDHFMGCKEGGLSTSSNTPEAVASTKSMTGNRMVCPSGSPWECSNFGNSSVETSGNTNGGNEGKTDEIFVADGELFATASGAMKNGINLLLCILSMSCLWT